MKRVAFILLSGWLGGVVPAFSESPPSAGYHLVLARLLADEGEIREATESFIEAIELAPDDPYVRLEYSKFLLRQRRLDKAAQQAAAARRLAPREVDVLRAYADTQMKLAGQDSAALDAARGALEELRALAPEDAESMVTLGQIYLSESRPGEAAEVFQEVLDRTSGNRMVFRLLVDALLRDGQVERAEEVLRHSLSVDPLFTRARTLLAEILGQQGRHQDAVDLLSSAPEPAAQDPELLKRLALELHRAGDSERALVIIDRVLDEEPGYHAGLYLKTVILSGRGDNEAAIDLAERLLALDPSNLEVAVLLSSLLTREGRTDDAVRELEEVELRLRDSDQDDVAEVARGQRALILAREERWDQVAAVLEPSLPALEDAGELELILLCSEALARTGQRGKAMALLNRIEPDSPAGRAALAKRAEIAFRLGEEQAGNAGIAELVATGEFEDLLRAAEVFQRLERYAAAIPILEQALELQVESTQAMFWLGASYERGGRLAEAEVVLQRLLELEPDFAPALNYLGYMWADQGQNLERALRLTEKAVALEPDNGAYVDSLGWAHFQLGQLDEARDYLELAARLVGDDAVVFEHLGDLYRVLGQLESARRLYQRAVDLEGENFQQVREKLDQLPVAP